MTGVKLIFTLTKGESEGYTVKSREDDFPISNYPLEQTEFFYSQKQGIASLMKLYLKLAGLLNFHFGYY